MMRFRVYSLMVALFVLGLICGMLLSIGVVNNKIRSFSATSTPEVSAKIVRFLDLRLRLTPEQEAAVEEVLREGEKEVLPLRREFRERMLAIIKNYKPKVAQHLKASQQRELDEIVERLLRTWQLSKDPDR